MGNGNQEIERKKQLWYQQIMKTEVKQIDLADFWKELLVNFEPNFNLYLIGHRYGEIPEILTGGEKFTPLVSSKRLDSGQYELQADRRRVLNFAYHHKDDVIFNDIEQQVYSMQYHWLFGMKNIQPSKYEMLKFLKTEVFGALRTIFDKSSFELQLLGLNTWTLEVFDLKKEE
jgi:hypothetical protein